MAGEKKSNTFPKTSPEELNQVGKKIRSKAQKVGKKIGETTEQLEKKFEKEISKGKEGVSGANQRWVSKSTGEKVTTILGAIFLLRGIIALRQFLGGIILVILGVLLVSGTLNPLFDGILGSSKNKK